MPQAVWYLIPQTPANHNHSHHPDHPNPPNSHNLKPISAIGHFGFGVASVWSDKAAAIVDTALEKVGAKCLPDSPAPRVFVYEMPSYSANRALVPLKSFPVVLCKEYHFSYLTWGVSLWAGLLKDFHRNFRYYRLNPALVCKSNKDKFRAFALVKRVSGGGGEYIRSTFVFLRLVLSVSCYHTFPTRFKVVCAVQEGQEAQRPGGL
jgi:hypothetical protein